LNAEDLRPPVDGGRGAPFAEGHSTRLGYTPAMGAVETMEDFFERLNTGDREGAVALMDDATEMRVHVGDSVQTYRGIERVGGWFLRGDKGLRMIPGDVRDTGNTYEADIVVVRPGAPSQHLDATFRVEAGKITSINLAPR
jgi:ketosteroid isomerase-like protein